MFSGATLSDIGTFPGLPQGAAVTLNGVDYALLYTGDDGNDVVLTDLSISATISRPSTANEVTPPHADT